MSLTEVPRPRNPPVRRLHNEEVARLVGAAAGGNQQAWKRLVDEYDGLLWAVARAHRLSDAYAADVVQTTWLRLVEHLGALREPEHLGAWLATTARRECLRALRLGQRQIPTEQEVFDREPSCGSVDAELMVAERDSTLWEAFGRLPARDQALLRLLVADPAPSYEEIGAALDMPIGSIGPTRMRCLRRLRTEVERLGLTELAA